MVDDTKKEKIPKEIKDISYYTTRLDLVWISSVVLIIYLVLNFFCFHYFKIISPKLLPTFFNNNFWLYLLLAILGLFGIIAVLCLYGSKTEVVKIAGHKVFTPSPSRSLKFLVAATVLFIFLLSLPVFFLGGPRESCFGTLLIMTTGLTVVISRSWKIRMAFIAICLLSYTTSSIYFIPIIINSPRFYNFFYVLGTFTSICITIFLSSRAVTVFEQ